MSEITRYEWKTQDDGNVRFSLIVEGGVEHTWLTASPDGLLEVSHSLQLASGKKPKTTLRQRLNVFDGSFLAHQLLFRSAMLAAFGGIYYLSGGGAACVVLISMLIGELVGIAVAFIRTEK